MFDESYDAADAIERSQKLMNEIKDGHKRNGEYQVTRVEHKNVMLVGRTRIGKSTIKSLLIDPTIALDHMTLRPCTRDPVSESFHVPDKQIVLNIVDTPGLFQHITIETDIRDNDTILDAIEACTNREITQIHVVCFCMNITCGINQIDIDSLNLLIEFFGRRISTNSCLIITQRESKTEHQRARILAELSEDIHFRELMASFFRLGIFFSGALNRDTYDSAHPCLLDQFVTICDYRTKLIELFSSKIEPYPISDMLTRRTRLARDEESLNDIELQTIKAQADEQARIIEELRLARLSNQRDTTEIVDRLLASHSRKRPERTYTNEHRQKPNLCSTS